MNGKRHGFGKIVSSDKGEYEGEWRHDMYHGNGKWLHPSGDSYEGEQGVDVSCGLFFEDSFECLRDMVFCSETRMLYQRPEGRIGQVCRVARFGVRRGVEE